jgi:glycerol uptake facilitator protein
MSRENMRRGFLPVPRRGSLAAEFLAEFFGIAILITLGDGVVANTIFAPRLQAFGIFQNGPGYNWNTIAWGWALAVVMAVYVAGGITGAHINPAVTLAAVVRRGMPFGKACVYWLAQILGAFLGAFIVWVVYYGDFQKRGFTNVFYTSPGINYGGMLWQNFLVELIGTFALVLFIYAIVDNINNLGPGANLWPFMVGLAVFAIGLSLGGPTGYAINPARDFGPRVFSVLIGDRAGFQGLYWLVVPIIGPLVGGVLGAWFYDATIANWLPSKQPVTAESEAEVNPESHATEM